MPFRLTEDHLRDLFASSNLHMSGDEMIFLGFRGCIPANPSSQNIESEHLLELVGVDYAHMRCSLVQWRPGSGFALFPGSTVPNINAVRSHIPKHGAGVNQLSVGFYCGSHAYVAGEHSSANASRAHRAFRNTSPLPVWRTSDDDDFDGSDPLSYDVAYDNLHCAWQMNPSMPDYSSNGCQVVAGRPRVLSRGWDTELGPWAEFVDRAYACRQARYSYALFSGREVLALSTAAGAYESRNVRFGSSGELVYVVQDALLKNGFDLGPAGADGELGWGTLQAVRQVQRKGFGPSGVDLVVGPGTAKLLGIDWPDRSGSLPPLIAPLPGMLSVGSVTAGGIKELLVAPNFRSLLPGGFFSSEPYNLSVRRSIRTNNPGALNISAWQRLRKGFAGVTQPDKAGNVTSIYVTPEHGIAAWYYLLSDRYGYGSVGSFTVGELACRYAGIADPADPAVLSYVAGWKKWVDKSLKAQTRIALADDAAMLLFAKGMFSHECGKVTPLHDDQVLEALRLERTGSLPAN